MHVSALPKLLTPAQTIHCDKTKLGYSLCYELITSNKKILHNYYYYETISPIVKVVGKQHQLGKKKEKYNVLVELLSVRHETPPLRSQGGSLPVSPIQAYSPFTTRYAYTALPPTLTRKKLCING